MKLKEVLEKEVSKISPSSNEIVELVSIAEDIISKLKKVGLTAKLGGSLAKGTVVKKDVQDIDVFIIFSSKDDLSIFDSKVKEAKLGGKLRLVHGSRDYYQVDFGSVVVELIPTVSVDKPENAENVTDVSLLHVRYVTSKISKNSMIANDIRLAKVFCQANNCYGAEGYVRGFSGYALEVLVLHFGGFVNFLKKVGSRKVIDVVKYFKNEREVLFELNESKLQGPLIVVDPTYKYRNVTAGLGEKTFLRFLTVSKEFLKSPSLDFFVKKDLDVSELATFASESDARLFSADIVTNRQEGDIAGTKCLKFLDFFCDELERLDQKVLRREFEYNGGKKAKGYLVVFEKGEINLKGPPVGMKNEVLLFEKEHDKTFISGGHVCTKRKVVIEEVFEKSNRVKDEMGVWGEKLEVV